MSRERRKAKVFISYSQADAHFVTRLADALEANNIPIWIDRKEILPGDSIPEAVFKGLDQADYVVVVLSPNSVGARWLTAETNAALMKQLSGKGGVIIPVLIGQMEPGDIPPALRHIAFADFRRVFDDGLHSLVAVLAQEAELLPAANRTALASSSSECVRELSALSSGALRRRITRQMNQDGFREMWLEITDTEIDPDLEHEPLWIRVTSLITWATAHGRLPAVLEWVCDHERRRRRNFILAAAVLILLIVGLIPFPYTLNDTTHVPATNGLGFDIPSLADFQDANQRASRGLIKLPPHATLSCEFVQDNGLWTDDRLQNIEDELQTSEVSVDITPLVHAWVDCQGDVDQFQAWLEKQHERLIVRNHLGTARSSVSDSADFRKSLNAFVKGELIPKLEEHKNDPPPIMMKVSAQKTNSFLEMLAKARRAFWKRIIGLNYLESDPGHRLGPYFHADGQSSKVETEGPGAGYPRGCLLAATYRVTVSDRELTYGDVVPFYDRTHVVENRGGAVQLIRLVMNDNITEDNGPGRCDVVFQIKGRASLFWQLWHRLTN